MRIQNYSPIDKQTTNMTDREYKFRCWDMDIQGWRYFSVYDFKEDWPIDSSLTAQWTGLNDMNRKHIFEGDILRLPRS